MSWLRRARRAPAPDAFAHLDAAPELALRDLRVTIDGRVLIERLSLTANAGQLWCVVGPNGACLLYTSPSPRDVEESRMPSSA